jgi:hypothetical protein
MALRLDCQHMYTVGGVQSTAGVSTMHTEGIHLGWLLAGATGGTLELAAVAKARLHPARDWVALVTSWHAVRLSDMGSGA